MKLTYKTNPDNPKKVDLYAGNELIENLFCVEGSVRISKTQLEGMFFVRIDNETKKVKKEKVSDENKSIENKDI